MTKMVLLNPSMSMSIKVSTANRILSRRQKNIGISLSLNTLGVLVKDDNVFDLTAVPIFTQI